MKKFLAVLLVLCFAFAIVACDNGGAAGTDTTAADTTAADTTAADTTAEDTEGGDTEPVEVMSYDEYLAAEIDSPVVIDLYVQATQSWWNDSITVYGQDTDGGYFIYNMTCSEEDAAKLVPGTKIRVTGYKAEWGGEIEVAEGATFEFLDEEPVTFAATDITEFLGTDELINYMNQLVCFSGLTVVAKKDADGNEKAFFYNWDNSGEQGNDLYFDVALGDNVYTFSVESYLCDKDSDVYQYVEALEIGKVVDIECFLYWYEGAPSPHVTSVSISTVAD